MLPTIFVIFRSERNFKKYHQKDIGHGQVTNNRGEKNGANDANADGCVQRQRIQDDH